MAVISRLVASDGSILIPGVDDMVSAADVEEQCVFPLFENISLFFSLLSTPSRRVHSAICDKPDYSIADVESSAGARLRCFSLLSSPLYLFADTKSRFIRPLT